MIHVLMRRILVIGSSGLLGKHLVNQAPSRGLEPIGRHAGNGMDITDIDSVSAGVADARPDMAVLAAALADVAYCESHPQEAWAVNAEGALNVAMACKAARVPLAFVSTDAVFNGEKGSRYDELDAPDPLSRYGMTKLEGERAVLDASSLNLVCRASALYDPGSLDSGNGYLGRTARALLANERVELRRDRFSSPTSADECASAIIDLMLSRQSGVRHVAGPDCLSRLEAGRALARHLRRDETLCAAADRADRRGEARLPRRTCLDSTATYAILGRELTGFEAGLRSSAAADER